MKARRVRNARASTSKLDEADLKRQVNRGLAYIDETAREAPFIG